MDWMLLSDIGTAFRYYSQASRYYAPLFLPPISCRLKQTRMVGGMSWGLNLFRAVSTIRYRIVSSPKAPLDQWVRAAVDHADADADADAALSSHSLSRSLSLWSIQGVPFVQTIAIFR